MGELPIDRFFLHRHPDMENQKKIDSKHVIIDKDAWALARGCMTLQEDGGVSIEISAEYVKAYTDNISGAVDAVRKDPRIVERYEHFAKQYGIPENVSKTFGTWYYRIRPNPLENAEGVTKWPRLIFLYKHGELVYCDAYLCGHIDEVVSDIRMLFDGIPEELLEIMRSELGHMGSHEMDIPIEQSSSDTDPCSCCDDTCGDEVPLDVIDRALYESMGVRINHICAKYMCPTSDTFEEFDVMKHPRIVERYKYLAKRYGAPSWLHLCHDDWNYIIRPIPDARNFGLKKHSKILFVYKHGVIVYCTIYSHEHVDEVLSDLRMMVTGIPEILLQRIHAGTPYGSHE